MSYVRIIVLGHVGAAPDIRRLANGATVASFSIATNEKKKGEEVVNWWRCECYQAGDTGLVTGVIQKYVDRGGQVMVEGSPTMESWTDKKTGEVKTALKVRINSLQLCGGKGERAAKPANGDAPAPFVGPPGDALGNDDVPF